MTPSIKYHYYKADFYSAYNNNGNNIDLAIIQVSILRNVTIDEVKTVLRNLITEFKTKQQNENK